MNIGQNILDLFSQNAQPLVIVAIIAIGLYLAFKREFSKLIGFGIIAVIAILLVFNPTGVKDLFLKLGNTIINSGAAG